MRILVYVEGPSDRLAMEILLAPLIGAARQKGIGIRFLVKGGKDPILQQLPKEAADYLTQHPEDWVIALPDLYPMDRYQHTDDAHASFQELELLLQRRFIKHAQHVGLGENVHQHFVVHCFKHDMEALLLAAEEPLKQRLKTTDRLRNWRLPVENQNDNAPPKRIVETLFKKYRKNPEYSETSDVPWILSRVNLAEIEVACPQNFAPFVQSLRQIIE